MASSSPCNSYNFSNQQQEPGLDWAGMFFSNPYGLVDPNVQQGQQQQQQHHQQQQQYVDSLDINGGLRNDQEGPNNGGGKEKKSGGRVKKASRPRFAFQTRTDNDILDDGYRWRKYGQKAVKNSSYPRCTHHTCDVKKQVQRLSKDTSIVVTTYEGVHNHPCEKLMEALTPILKQIQFLSRF
ncbi:putative transcription factor WRKY family [Dioscorea sansibarensis]